jgi:hypothetical protein
MTTAVIDSGLDRPGIDSLQNELLQDFARACTELAEARRQQRAKDTPAHRTAVRDSHARVDAVLDMYLMYVEIDLDRSDTAGAAGPHGPRLPDAA